MGFFDRMGKVISSNLNALLDKATDEKKLTELNLEQMGEQLREGRQEVVSALAAEKTLRKRVDGLRAEIETWDKRAELALRTDDEALAREALRQKKRVESQHGVAEKARAEQESVALRFREEVDRMDRRLEELTMRRASLGSGVVSSSSANAETSGLRSGSGAFDKFRKVEESIDGREQERLAMHEVEQALGKESDHGALEDKFRQMEQAHAGENVDDELEALKKRIRV